MRIPPPDAIPWEPRQRPGVTVSLPGLRWAYGQLELAGIDWQDTLWLRGHVSAGLALGYYLWKTR